MNLQSVDLTHPPSQPFPQSGDGKIEFVRRGAGAVQSISFKQNVYTKIGTTLCSCKMYSDNVCIYMDVYAFLDIKAHVVYMNICNMHLFCNVFFS